MLRPYLVVEGARNGLKVDAHFSAFNQIEQQALDAGSDLYRSRPSVIAIVTLLEDVAPALAGGFLSLSTGAIDAAVAGIRERFDHLLAALREHTDAAIVVFNYAPPMVLEGGFADPLLNPSQSSVVQRVNDALADVCRGCTGAFVFDYAHVAAASGLTRMRDTRLWYIGRVPFGAAGQIVVAQQLMRWKAALRRTQKKSLEHDLDDTLWGGIVGEDGPQGIALGDAHPGNVYKDFHRFLLRLRDRGILLAVASKNNERDALDVLEKHPDCLLRPEHFAAMEINWQDKATSLRAIARRLNIDTSALAFFDDNPMEREWVKAELPEVAVIDAPKSASGYASAILESRQFDQVALSGEDRLRAASYHHEREREALRSSAPSLDAFLRQLDLRATIGRADAETLPRVSQLLLKTNQFNLTTRRHDVAALNSMSANGGAVLWLRAADRLGDSGLVGVAIAVPREDATWTVDTLLMSCRVLGRGLEHALVSALVDAARAGGATTLIGEYIPTAKNAQVADLYPRLGFEPVAGQSHTWRFDIQSRQICVPDYIQLQVV
jgi:FkbH-like protein